MNKRAEFEFLEKLYQLFDEYDVSFTTFGSDFDIEFDINSQCYVWPHRSIDILSIRRYLKSLKKLKCTS